MGKLVNKKYLIIVLLCSLCFFNLYSQNNQNNTVSNFDESSIILSSDTVNPTIDDNSIKGTSTIGLLLRVIIVLVIVVGLIYGVLWFIKRKTNIVKTEDDFLRRVSYINIAPGKSVEVITLIDKAYLIGVTEDNITLLGEIDDKELINAMNVNADKKGNVKKPLNFADVLDLFTAKGKKNSNVFTDTEKQIEKMYENNGDNENNENV